jgi:hypothetical protein
MSFPVGDRSRNRIKTPFDCGCNVEAGSSCSMRRMRLIPKGRQRIDLSLHRQPADSISSGQRRGSVDDRRSATRQPVRHVGTTRGRPVWLCMAGVDAARSSAVPTGLESWCCPIPATCVAGYRSVDPSGRGYHGYVRVFEQNASGATAGSRYTGAGHKRRDHWSRQRQRTILYRNSRMSANRISSNS